MEDVVRSLRETFQGRSVLITGHTGFKGSWLSIWLKELGASVQGYALSPQTDPSMFVAAGVEDIVEHYVADVRDLPALRAAIRRGRPEFVFHLAAQPLVRLSYEEPLSTIHTNVIGTANLLEAIRLEGQQCAVVIVTSDKCYENRERLWGYREDEALGGHDVYSMSKAAAELVAASYRRSFFAPEELHRHGVAVATARAGNVIGGGDWAADRIVPDIVRSVEQGQPLRVRNPQAVRPWQHVLDPLYGYLCLASRLASESTEDARQWCDAWNFGPSVDDCRAVSDVVSMTLSEWGSGEWIDASGGEVPHEAGVLRLNTEKAAIRLGWNPRWRLSDAVKMTVAWYRAHQSGASPRQLHRLSRTQIERYMRGCS